MFHGQPSYSYVKLSPLRFKKRRFDNFQMHNFVYFVQFGSFKLKTYLLCEVFFKRAKEMLFSSGNFLSSEYIFQFKYVESFYPSWRDANLIFFVKNAILASFLNFKILLMFGKEGIKYFYYHSQSSNGFDISEIFC